MKRLVLSAVLLSAVLIVLAIGCGGGGGSSSTTSSSGGGGGGGGTAQPITISGTAAFGAPLDGATITVYSGGSAVASVQNAVGSDGSYSVTIPAGVNGPFVILAKRDDVKLFSVKPDSASGRANLTQITTLIASRLSSNGDPAQLVADAASNAGVISPAAVSAKKAEILAVVQPLLTALGQGSADPLTATFSANGSGYDHALDSLLITVLPAGTQANVNIMVKGDDSSNLSFTSGVSRLPPLPAVNTSLLPPSGLYPEIATLISSVNACFQVPVGQRVSGNNVVHSACTSLFVNNDPTAYKHNGQIVAQNQAFGGLFSNGATGTTFLRGNYEFTRGNGDIVVSFKTVSPNGSFDFGTWVVRDQSGVLKLIGNQYNYPGGVVPYSQSREYIGQGAAAFYSTGYDLRVNNSVDGSGNPIFYKVVVTSPKGNKITLVPASGDNSLEITNNFPTPLRTSYVRINASWADPTTAATKNYPSAYEPNLFFSPQGTFSDTDIAGFANQSVWTFEYWLANNQTATPDATQTYRTLTRPLTLAELKTMPLPNADAATVNNAFSQRVSLPRYGVPLDVPGNSYFAYLVPQGAIPPYNVKLWGFYGSGNFNDGIGVPSNARDGTVGCTQQTQADTHCNGSSFVSGDYMDGFHLLSKTARTSEISHYYAIYNLNL